MAGPNLKIKVITQSEWGACGELEIRTDENVTRSTDSSINADIIKSQTYKTERFTNKENKEPAKIKRVGHGICERGIEDIEQIEPDHSTCE